MGILLKEVTIHYAMNVALTDEPEAGQLEHYILKSYIAWFLDSIMCWTQCHGVQATWFNRKTSYVQRGNTTERSSSYVQVQCFPSFKCGRRSPDQVLLPGSNPLQESSLLKP